VNLDEYRAELDALGCDPIAEPLGWECRTCGGRMTKPEPTSLSYALNMLLDAARAHRRAGCSA
jgi:hypothetical protein